MRIVKCNKCGATVEVMKDCTCDDCGIKCCGETMADVVINSDEYSFEKHMPEVEIVGTYIEVTVPHVMEEGHYIEWLALVSDRVNAKKYFGVGDNLKAIFPYVKGSKVYAYCNLHGLWEYEINK